MPRELRPRRGAAARGSNQSVYGNRPVRGRRAAARPLASSPLTTSSSNMSISNESSTSALKFSQIFPTFNSSVNDGVQAESMENGEAMALKLREHVFSVLNRGPKADINFADFYNLVQVMMVQKSEPGIYKVVHDCISQFFNAFADSLTFESTRQLSDVFYHSPAFNLSAAQSILSFHSAFFGDKLPLLASALVNVERRSMLSPEKPILLHELCCRTFVESILSREPVKKYIVKLMVVFFTRMRERYSEKLLAKVSQQQFPEEINFKLQSSYVVSALLKLIVSFDQKHFSVFHHLVYLPLMKRSINFGRLVASDQLRAIQQQPEKKVIDYLRWLSNYLKLDRYLLEKQFGFPSGPVMMMNAVLGHVMGSMQMSSFIISYQSSGFNVLLKNYCYEEISLLYDLLVSLRQQTKQKAFLDEIEQNIEQHLAQVGNVITAKFNLKTRNDQVAFVAELLTLQNKLQRMATIIGKMEQIVFRFFKNILHLYEAVPLALSFFMHSLMLKSSNVHKSPFGEMNQQLLHASIPLSLKSKLGPLSVDESERMATLYQLLSFVKHIKDINSFFDYCKHFFCSRLLNLSASVFSTSQELSYFELLVTEIKRINVNNANLSMNNGNSILTIADFYAIVTSWLKSENFTANKRDTDGQHLMADLLRICQLGIWKFLPFDRCALPLSLESTFKKVEEEYRKSHKNRRLLLNTSQGQATIEARPLLWSGQVSNEPAVNLRVSFHQLAILKQFNAVAPNVAISYEQLLQGGRYMMEDNAKLALLSLVYCGLLRVSQSSVINSSLHFEINEGFYQDNQKALASDKQKDKVTIDLASLEQIDFWSNDSSIVDAKTSTLMQSLGIADVDIVMASTVKSVENVRSNLAFILLNQLKEANLTNKTQNGQVVSNSTGNRISNTTEHAVDRLVKIEAAISRVVKRARRLLSMQEIYLATKTELFTTSRMPFLPTDVLTTEEVNTLVLNLVEKKYIKRDKTGKFEFVLA